jgi:hypothetical protein
LGGLFEGERAASGTYPSALLSMTEELVSDESHTDHCHKAECSQARHHPDDWVQCQQHDERDRSAVPETRAKA